MFPTDEILNKYKLFWQYPAITEKTFFLQNKYNENFLGFPWATIIDKKYNLRVIYNILKQFIDPNKTYYACCQHIYFKHFIGLWKVLNIKTVYVSHKIKGEDVIDGIILKPCPLYAVNIENDDFNKEFKDIYLLNVERNILYNFIGGYQKGYLTQIRPNIFKMKHPENTIIRNTGDWHLNKLVYNEKQNFKHELNLNDEHINKTKYYNELLINSQYTLAPSGTGPNSIRFWEALGAGSIPVLLADTLELPEHELWNDAIIILEEDKINELPDLLKEINPEKERKMRENCLKIYNDLKNNYKAKLNMSDDSNTSNILNKIIIHYCCGSYLQSTGGVARYDYHIYKAFPKRNFFQGPQQKNQLLEFLERYKQYKDNIVIITDNHLSCDIPNEYNVLLVHHGVAKTTAARNPDWKEPWKSLCTKGQDNMLTYRDPMTTKIVSISQACTDDFTKYYRGEYTKFERIDIPHASELDETRYKGQFNKTPIVLGNWNHIKKGQKIIPILKQNIPIYTFRQLSVNLDQKGYDDFNRRKQDIYLQSDIFLQISNSEGNSYATLDALICGLPIVASNVGLFYKDVPEDCFVKLEWERNGDVKYVQEKLEYAWEHRESLSKNARKWYMENCRFTDWINKMRKLI